MMKEGLKFEVTKCCGAAFTFYINPNNGQKRDSSLKMCTNCKKPSDVETVVVVKEKTISVLNKFLSRKSNHKKVPDMVVASFITKSLMSGRNGNG